MSLLGNIFNQINPFDGGKTFKNPQPRPQARPQGKPKVNAQQLAQALQNGSVGRNMPAQHKDQLIKLLNQINKQQNYKLPALPQNQLMGFVGREFIARPATEIGATVSGKTFHPGNRVEKAILGKTPVKPIQETVRGTYRDVKGGKVTLPGDLPVDPRLAIPFAIANAGVHILNDVPVGSLAVKGIKQGAGLASKGAKVAMTTPEVRMNIKDQQVLKYLTDYRNGVYKAKPSDLNVLLRDARAVGQKHGVDLVNGTPQQQIERASGLLDQLGAKNRAITQGGYAKFGKSPQEVPKGKTPQVSVPAETSSPIGASSRQLSAEQQNLVPKRGKQLQQQELSPQSTGLQKNLQTNPTPINSPSTLANNTTKVGLNTERLNLSKAGKKNLAAETTTAVDRMSNKDIQQMAKDVGLDTKTHSPEQTRKIIAEQLNVRQDAIRLQNEAEVASKSGDHELAAQLLRQSAERGRTSRAQGTELAQQLQARRIIANELDTPQQRIFKLLDNAGVNPEVYSKRLATVDFNDGNEVIKAFREMVPPTKWEWLDAVRYNSMLSSPLTHAINAVSNAVNIGVVAPVEKTVKGMLDAAGGLFGHERQYAAGEGGAYVSGAINNIRKAADNFVDAMRGAPENYNLDLTDISTPLAKGGIKGGTYDVLSFPMRLLGASDKFFRTLASGGEEAALALRQAKGIKVKGDIQALGQAEADYRLFQQETGIPGQGQILDSIDSVTNSIMKLRKDHVWAKFVFPFVKTPTNILKQGVEFSPLGLANAVTAEDKVVALTRAAIGTAVFGASAAMLESGDLTWGEPTNKKEKDRFKAEGKQPYAMRIGGHWVSFAKLPPAISFPFALTAAIDDAIKSKKMNEKTSDAILEGVAKWGQFLGDQSYVKNIGDTLAAFKGDSEKVVTAVSNYPQQLVPFRALTGWIARMTDDTERQVNTDKGFIDKQVQSLMMNYPGLRQQLDTRNYQGQPIPANNPVLNSFTPIKITDDRGVSPIDQAKDNAKKLKDNTPDIPDNKKKAYEKYIDKQVSQAQNELVNTADFKALDDKEKGKALDSIKTKYTSAYKRQFMADNGIPIDKEPTSSDVKILGGEKDVISLSKSSSKTKADYSKTPDAEYKAAVKQFESDVKSNSLSDVQKIKRQKEINKLKIGSTYDKNIRDLYSLSKDDAYSYLSTAENGKDKAKMAEQLLAYDQALLDAGLIKYRKFKNGITPSSKKTGVGKGKGGRGGKGRSTKATAIKFRLPGTPKVKAAPRPKVGKSKQKAFIKVSSGSKPKKIKLSA